LVGSERNIPLQIALINDWNIQISRRIVNQNFQEGILGASTWGTPSMQKLFG